MRGTKFKFSIEVYLILLGGLGNTRIVVFKVRSVSYIFTVWDEIIIVLPLLD
jgi:hypothetical protein